VRTEGVWLLLTVLRVKTGIVYGKLQPHSSSRKSSTNRLINSHRLDKTETSYK